MLDIRKRSALYGVNEGGIEKSVSKTHSKRIAFTSQQFKEIKRIHGK